LLQGAEGGRLHAFFKRGKFARRDGRVELGGEHAHMIEEIERRLYSWGNGALLPLSNFLPMKYTIVHLRSSLRSLVR